MALEVGQRIGDYEVQALLGTGGMGRVYKVRNIISNREEAMKVLLPDFASEPELAARFMAEIRTLAGLDHPNIAQLRTAFQFQNELVMIMEFVEGTTLDKMASESKIPIDRVLEYSIQVLSALSFAHGRGVTHRDIKPANIMVTAHGLVKLMDFGIAKSANDLQLTRPGTTMGSIYYMSPEQVCGGTIDARSDIYSFGVTLYEMLTGRKPFQADTSYSVLNAQMNEAPMPPVQVNPEIPRELNDIVLRAMVKLPDGRFQTADEFRNALKVLRKQPEPQTTFQPVPPPVSQGFAPVAPPAFAQSAPQLAPQAQGFAPVSVPASTSAPRPAKSHRGLWVGLGALAVAAVLVMAALLLPHVFSTHAGQSSGGTATDTKTSATTPDSGSTTQPGTPTTETAQPPNGSTSSTPEAGGATPSTGNPSGAASNSGSSSTPSSPRPGYTKPQKSEGSSAQSSTTGGGAAQATGSTPQVPAGPSPQEVRQAHDRLMNLDARAESVRSGIAQIRGQQQAQGLDLRGDILAALSRMNNNLTAADRALSQNDLEAAKDYMERADKEAAKLESFLGR